MSVTGTWNLTLNSPLGDQAATLNLEEVGGVLQGTLTGKGESGPVQRLTVEGAECRHTRAECGRVRCFGSEPIDPQSSSRLQAFQKAQGVQVPSRRGAVHLLDLVHFALGLGQVGEPGHAQFMGQTCYGL